MYALRQEPYTMEDYHRVLSLKKQGLSQNKIQELTGISSTTVWDWVNTHQKPRFLYAQKQQRRLSSSARKLSKELAYIMGVLIGDGHLENNKNKRINLFVKDKDFAVYFYKILEKWSKLKPLISTRKVKTDHKTKYGNWIKSNSRMYTVRLNSVQAIDFLKDKIDCRTYTWKVPQMILNCYNEKIIGFFLKGFFDSEGSSIFYKDCRRVEATILNPNNSLESIQKLLIKLGIKSTIRSAKHNTYVLRILDRKSLELFNQKIGFTIKRKRELLKKIIKSYKRYGFINGKTKEEIITSLRTKPKTIRQMSFDINKSYSTIKYHLKDFLNQNKVKIINKINYSFRPSNVWSLI